jgi:hypothetical protein
MGQHLAKSAGWAFPIGDLAGGEKRSWVITIRKTSHWVRHAHRFTITHN